MVIILKRGLSRIGGYTANFTAISRNGKMRLRWFGYLVAGIILTGIIIFSAIGIYHVVASGIPVLGPDIPANSPKLPA